MCFGKGGAPTQVENQQAAEQMVEAEAQVQEAVQGRARQKAEDIETAISASTVRQGRGGGRGRRSLFQSGFGGAGFLDRFNR
jgi:hypothetical protein